MLKLWSKLVFWILPSGSVARLFANSRLLKNEDESKQDAAKIFESSNIMHHDWRVCFRLPSSLPFAHLSSGCVQALCTLCTMNSNPRSFPGVIKVIQKDTSTGTATCTEQPKRRQTTKCASSYLQFKGISTVSPTSSSADSNEIFENDLSFSTGGGGGTSILEGVTNDSAARPFSVNGAGGPFFAGTSGIAGGDDGVGGNLNSRFIVPLLLFLFDSALVVRSSFKRSASASSPGSSVVDSSWRAEVGWLTNAEAWLGGVAADWRAGAGIEAR